MGLLMGKYYGPVHYRALTIGQNSLLNQLTGIVIGAINSLQLNECCANRVGERSFWQLIAIFTK